MRPEVGGISVPSGAIVRRYSVELFFGDSFDSDEESGLSTSVDSSCTIEGESVSSRPGGNETSNFTVVLD